MIPVDPQKLGTDLQELLWKVWQEGYCHGIVDRERGKIKVEEDWTDKVIKRCEDNRGFIESWCDHHLTMVLRRFGLRPMPSSHDAPPSH